MNSTYLTSLWQRDPIDALAHLAWALRNDVPWRTRCGQASVPTRQTALLAARNQDQEPELYVDDGFALLAALDQYLADQRIGAAPLYAIVEDHDPPLWVAPRPKGWKPKVGGPDQVARWMRHHAVGPSNHAGIEVRITQAPARLARAWHGRDTVMVAGFTDGTGPLNEAEQDAFHTADLTEPEVRRKSLDALLPVVSRNPLQTLVLPELTLPPAMRQEWMGQLVDSGLAPLVTVAGTYHKFFQDKRRNVAILADAHGRTLIQQYKIHPLHTDSVQEVISGGNVIELLVGPWGTLAVAICRDFCEHNNHLWTTLAPDLVLVPSMGNPQTINADKRRAKELELAADTLVCMANQPVDFGENSPIYGLIYGRGVDITAESDDAPEHVCYRIERVPGGLEED